MAQGRQQNNGSRQRCAQSAAAKAPAEPPKAVCAQLEQMNRKLAAASAEILRYQTRLFACERQMAALRQENAQLEAACEQRGRRLSARALMQSSCVRSWPAMRKLCGLCRLRRIRPRSRNHPAAQSPRPEPEAEQPGPEAPQPAQPDWKPQTRLEHLSVELMNWFDDMMGA